MLFLSGLLLMSGLESCNVMDVTKEFTMELEFKAISDQNTINVGEVLDAARANAYISDYGINIKKIEVTEVTYWISAHNGPENQIIKFAKIIITDENGESPEVLGQIHDKSIRDLMNNDKTMTLEQPGINRFAELVKSSPYTAKISLIGDTDCSPLNFVLEFKIKVKMTASPL